MGILFTSAFTSRLDLLLAANEASVFVDYDKKKKKYLRFRQ
jgi:hypothetical protein